MDSSICLLEPDLERELFLWLQIWRIKWSSLLKALFSLITASIIRKRYVQGFNQCAYQMFYTLACFMVFMEGERGGYQDDIQSINVRVTHFVLV